MTWTVAAGRVCSLVAQAAMVVVNDVHAVAVAVKAIISVVVELYDSIRHFHGGDDNPEESTKASSATSPI